MRARSLLTHICLLAAVYPAVSAPAATSSSVVSATVPSATSVDVSGCLTGADDVTDFGIVQPGSSVVTGTDCVVGFGSSNDTAALRMGQLDGIGRAMWARTTGTLDSSFGSGGTGIHTRNLSSIGDDLHDVSVAPNGRVVAAGVSTGNMLAASYLADGTPDTSFSGDGFVAYDWDNTGYEQAAGVLSTGDGGLFIVGTDTTTLSGSSSADALLVKFSPDGSRPGSFGSSGVVPIAATTGADEAVDLAFDPLGRVLAVGSVANASKDFTLVRVDATTGALDTSFGTAGRVDIDVGSSTTDSAAGLVVDPRSDRTFVAGTSGSVVAVAAITSAGALDGSFGVSGVRTFDVGSSEVVAGIGVDDLGRPYVAGEVDAGGPDDAWIARLTTTGDLDPAYGSGGIRIRATPADEIVRDLAVDGDGGAVLVGDVAAAPAIIAFTPAGSVDPTFGTDGIQQPAVFGAGTSEAFSVMRSADGSLVIAGGFTPTAGPSGSEAAVARLAMPTVEDFATGTTDWSNGPRMFATCLRGVGGSAITDGTTWSATGSCAAGAVDPWRAVPTTAASAGSKVAMTNASGASGSALLRFGLRVASNQAPGTYLAPVTFEVIAPAT